MKNIRNFCEKKPELVSSKYNLVRNNLKSFLDLKKTKLTSKYKDFKFPEEVLNWFKNLKEEKTLFLTGKSGVGKTSGMVCLLGEYNPLLIHDINGLKDLKEDNKALILDDLNWSRISRETKIHLLYKEYNSQIRILYYVVNLPPGIIKVVTSNKSTDLLSMFDDDKSIQRRLVHVHVDLPMYVQNNSQNNITINVNLVNKQEINEKNQIN